MKSNIYRLWLASGFSLCCLFSSKTVTAQEIFLRQENFNGQYQKVTVISVTPVTENLNIDLTTNATYIGKTTNNLKRNVAITNSKNVELKSSQSTARTGLAPKGGKKPPRKG